MRENLIYKFAVWSVRVYTRIMLKFDAQWHGELPSGPKLFVANHPSASDPFIIHLLSRDHLSVLISGNAFAMPLFGSFLRRAEQICVSSEQGKDAMEAATARLCSGHSVGIFPEGLVSPQAGGCHPAHTGAARLALYTGATVIPVGIYLPRERNVYFSSKLGGKKTGAYWYLRGPYFMSVGKPIKFSGDATDKELVQKVTCQIMDEIRLLSEESESRAREKINSIIPASRLGKAESVD